MRRAACLVFALLPLVGSPGCSARRGSLTSSQTAAVDRADALVREGCYGCLQEAHAIYSRLTGSAAGRGLRGAFEVTLLLAVREKELGLAPDVSLARARTLLSRVSRESSRHQAVNRDSAPILLAAAEAFQGDQSGLDAEDRQRKTDMADGQRPPEDHVEQVRQVLATRSLLEETAQYLAVALDCEQPYRSRTIDAAVIAGMAQSSELMRYRVGICSDAAPTVLGSLRAANARWTDTLFFEGKYEMGSPSRPAEPERAAALLKSASEAFAGSTSIQLMRASAEDLSGDFAAALASFERVLEFRPTHVDARLGRLKTLSYLGRADEGISAATTLIEMGSWHVGEAYYWRAWNEYQTRRLEPAWSDIEHAMRLWANTAVYALAGSIAYARKDLATAVSHFDRAFAMDASNCAAASSAGLVHVDIRAPQLAAESFSKAANCFAVAATAARADLAKLEVSALAPERRDKRLSSARKRVESADELAAQSAFNAAEQYVQSSQAQLALAHAEMAARHPGTRNRALALTARIANMR